MTNETVALIMMAGMMALVIYLLLDISSDKDKHKKKTSNH